MTDPEDDRDELTESLSEAIQEIIFTYTQGHKVTVAVAVGILVTTAVELVLIEHGWLDDE